MKLIEASAKQNNTDALQLSAVLAAAGVGLIGDPGTGSISGGMGTYWSFC
jgi:hypothetical protein